MRTLILVDLQVDFLPGGALAVPDSNAVIPVANKLQPYFDLVLAAQDWHPANHTCFAVNHPGKAPGDVIEMHGTQQILWPVHCVESSHGARFSPLLNRDKIMKVFHKGTDAKVDSYSAFFDNAHLRDTGLGKYLRKQGVTEIYLMGLTTDYCIKWSALDALDLGFTCCVITDGCRAVNLNAEDEATAYRKMADAGVHLLTSDELIRSIKRSGIDERPPQLLDEGNVPKVRDGERKILGEGKYLRLINDNRWEYVERKQGTGVVIIVAIYEGKLILTEQRRASVGKPVIEFPAGLVGDTEGFEKESFIDAAKRELLEETGFSAEQMIPLCEGPPSSGLSSEVVTLFLAKNLSRVGKGGGDEHENITVHEVPVEQLEAFTEAATKRGVLVDPKLFSGVYFAVKHRLVVPTKI